MPADDRLLIVKTHAFGDAMLCTPAVRELIASERDSRRVTVLTGPSAEPVWNRLQGVEQVITAPFPPTGLPGGVEFLSWSLKWRRRLREFSSSIVLQGDPRVRRWVRFLTGAPLRSCGERSLGRWEQVFPMRKWHFAGMEYARVAGVEPEDWRPSFAVSEGERSWAEGLLRGRRAFALAPGGGDNPRDVVPEKRWPSARFAEIINRLEKSGITPVLIGGPGDTAAAREAMEGSGGGAVDMTGGTDWGRTAALLERCAGYLGADSGPAHLAMAVGTPAVVVFGPTDPDSLYPPGGIVALRPELDCAPCYSCSLFPGCLRGEAICTGMITVASAWKAVREIIHEDNGS